MSNVATHCLLVVSSSQAIKGEAALKAEAISSALIPVPRTLTSECGVCLQVALVDRQPALETLHAAGIHVTNVHEIELTKPERRGPR